MRGRTAAGFSRRPPEQWIELSKSHSQVMRIDQFAGQFHCRRIQFGMIVNRIIAAIRRLGAERKRRVRRYWQHREVLSQVRIPAYFQPHSRNWRAANGEITSLLMRHSRGNAWSLVYTKAIME